MQKKIWSLRRALGSRGQRLPWISLWVSCEFPFWTCQNHFRCCLMFPVCKQQLMNYMYPQVVGRLISSCLPSTLKIRALPTVNALYCCSWEVNSLRKRGQCLLCVWWDKIFPHIFICQKKGVCLISRQCFSGNSFSELAKRLQLPVYYYHLSFPPADICSLLQVTNS